MLGVDTKEKEIVYCNFIPKGVILETNDSLFVGTGPITSEGDEQQ